MLYINLIGIVINILAQNGETRTLTLTKLINSYLTDIKIREPMVFDHILDAENKKLWLSFNNSIMVDWGDGNIDNITDHVYELSSKIYRVKIYNNREENLCTLSNAHWADGITDFISIGRIRIVKLHYMFSSTHFNGKIHPNWDTSQVTDMRYMFSSTLYFNQKFGSNWDTSQVTDMSHMFYKAYKFNQQIGDNWDTSQVRDMTCMFAYASIFNQKIGDNWDTRNVLYIHGMFAHTPIFNQKIGDNWNTGNVRIMSAMFYNASEFNQKIGDNWDISKVYDMSYMFGRASSFNQEIGRHWNTKNAYNMDNMFPSNYNPEYLPVWYKK